MVGCLLEISGKWPKDTRNLMSSEFFSFARLENKVPLCAVSQSIELVVCY